MATENFTNDELRCKCGCGLLPPGAFQIELQFLRNVYGRPMKLNSAARCPAYNARVSSTGRKGPHTVGAVDVAVYGQDAVDLIVLAIRHGWYGIGVSQEGPHESRFVHLDRRPFAQRAVWSY